MMGYSATITERWDRNTPIDTAGLVVRPRKWRASDLGGPQTATVDVIADGPTVRDVLKWLGCGIDIVNVEGAIVWSGMIDAVDLGYGIYRYDVDLADIANRVRPQYTTITADGEVASVTGDFVDDDFSQAIYGPRERTAIMSGNSDAAGAAVYTGRVLEARALPSAVRAGGDGGYRAELLCVGLFAELNHRYHENITGRTEYDPGDGVDHPIGWSQTDTSAGFVDSGELNTGGYSSFDSKLPPGPAGTMFSVSGSVSNDGMYTIVERMAESGEVLSTTADGAGFRFDGGDQWYVVEPMTEALGFLGVGQQFDIDITTSSQKDDGNYQNFGGGEPLESYKPDWPVEGIWAVREGGSERVRVDSGNRPAIEMQYDQGGVHDHPGIADGYLHGSITSSAYLRVSPRPAGDELGDGSDTYTIAVVGWRVAQKVTLAAADGGALWKIGIRLGRVGAPVDQVRVSVWTDSGGGTGFGSLVDEGFVDAADVSADKAMIWVEMAAAGTYELTGGASYHIVVERTGSHDPAAYWLLDIVENSDDLYDETARFYDGAGWIERTQPASVPFRLYTGRDITAEMGDIIDAYRLRIEGVDVADDAGVLTERYFADERTALDIVRELADRGTDDGAGVRVEMVHPRRVLISKRPTSSATRVVRIDNGRRPVYAAGGAPTPGKLFVGVWADEYGAPDPSSAIMPISPTYLAWMEYDADADRYDYGDDGASNRYDLGLVDG